MLVSDLYIHQALVQENARLRLNAVLAERGETYRSSVESWGSFRHIVEALQRVHAVLGRKERLQ